jgi:hypothetical protein
MREITQEEIDAVVDGALLMIASLGPSIFNFSNVKVTGENLENMCCLLRVLSTWRVDITGYEICISRCKTCCLEDGIDPQDILYGMIPKE